MKQVAHAFYLSYSTELYISQRKCRGGNTSPLGFSFAPNLFLAWCFALQLISLEVFFFLKGAFSFIKIFTRDGRGLAKTLCESSHSRVEVRWLFISWAHVFGCLKPPPALACTHPFWGEGNEASVPVSLLLFTHRDSYALPCSRRERKQKKGQLLFNCPQPSHWIKRLGLASRVFGFFLEGGTLCSLFFIPTPPRERTGKECGGRNWRC